MKISALILQTVDVFAIVALSGILSRLLTTGTVLVATSNRAPRELNQVFFLISFLFCIFIPLNFVVLGENLLRFM
jgi:predicted ATPase